MTPGESLRLVARLRAAYPRTEIAEDTLRVYAECLSDLDTSDATAAVLGLIATSRFFPTVAEIRERVVKDRNGFEDSGTAWASVLRAVHRWGRYREREALMSLEPLARQAAESVGWDAICNSTGPAERAHFLRVYENQKDAAMDREQARPLLEAINERGLLRTKETRSVAQLVSIAGGHGEIGGK